jgi:hypothetical protein
MNWKSMKKLFGFSRFIKKQFKDAHPDICPKCGRRFWSTDDFFNKTEKISSVFEKTESGEPVIIKVKCRCQSCGNIFAFNIDKRRDNSKEGCYVRDKFGNILEMLMKEGMSREEARKEMLDLFNEQERAYSKKKK